jgi:hypothetical protein
MSKLTTEPIGILEIFGVNAAKRELHLAEAAGSGKFSYTEGFPPETAQSLQQGGLPPSREDFNTVFNLLSQFAFYAQSGGSFTWAADRDYIPGCEVLGSNGIRYRCVTACGVNYTGVGAKNPTIAGNSYNYGDTGGGGYWLNLDSIKSYADAQIEAAQTAAETEANEYTDERFDALRFYPIGSYYTQYTEVETTNPVTAFPQSETPAALFGGTWKECFQGEGIFFRTALDSTGEVNNKRGQTWKPASGEVAAHWETSTKAGIQEDAIRNIEGKFNPGGESGGMWAEGAFATDTQGHIGSAKSDFDNWSYEFDASLVVPTAGENRPKNRMIKVWKRTA